MSCIEAAYAFLYLKHNISLLLDPYTLAILPIAHLTNRTDPFDRYCHGKLMLEESYRTVVNAGIRAYQLHVYLDLVQRYFGVKIRRLVYELQRGVFDSMSEENLSIEKTLELIMTALGTSIVTIPMYRGVVEVPVEMNVALLLLLDDPQSPDYVPNPALRSEQIGRIGKDVDWCIAECLIHGREDILDAFVPMLSVTYLAKNFC